MQHQLPTDTPPDVLRILEKFRRDDIELQESHSRFAVLLLENLPVEKPQGLPDKWVVDNIIKSTDSERKQMTKNFDRFAGKLWNPEELEKHDSRAFINYEFSTIQGIAPMLTDNPSAPPATREM